MKDEGWPVIKDYVVPPGLKGVFSKYPGFAVLRPQSLGNIEIFESRRGDIILNNRPSFSPDPSFIFHP